MLLASDKFGAEVEGVDVQLAHRVSLTLPQGGPFPADDLLPSSMLLPGGAWPVLSGAVKSVLIEEDLVTALPTGTRLVAGYPSRSATVVLGGLVDVSDETRTAAWLFDPFSQTSPLYRSGSMGLGAGITIDLGVWVDGAAEAEMLRRFTGRIDDVSVADNGEVTIVCLDRNSELHAVPDTPAVVTAEPFNSGLTSEFALDAILRASTLGAISSWPAQRPQCVLAAGMRASIWPEVGSLDPFTSQPFQTYVPGAFGSALSSTVSGDLELGLTIAYVLADPVEGTLFVEYWADPHDGAVEVSIGTGDLADGLQLYISLDRVMVESLATAGRFEYDPVADLADEPHYVAVKVALPDVDGTGWSGTLFVDDLATDFTIDDTGPRSPQPWTRCDVSTFDTASIEAVQVTTEADPVDNHAFVPQAVLEPSLNPLQVVPPLSGEAKDLITPLCEAEGAIAGFDEAGVFRFHNRNSRRGFLTDAARTISAKTSLKSLGKQVSGSLRRNHIRVPCTAWTYSDRMQVWAATDVIKVGARSTLTLPVVVSDTLICTLAAHDSGPMPEGGGTPGNTYWRASLDANGLTTINQGVRVTVRQLSGDTFAVDVRNQSNLPVYLVSPVTYGDLPPGSPCLAVGGVQVTAGQASVSEAQWPPLREGGAIASADGDLPLDMDDNPWCQDSSATDRFASDLLCDLRRPSVQMNSVAIVPDPRLVLADPVRIEFTDGATVVDDVVLILNNRSEWASGGHAQTISVQTFAQPGIFMLGVDGRCELGENTFV